MDPEVGEAPAEVYRRYLEAGEQGANLALVHGNGGILSSQVTAILGSAGAL